MFSAAWDRCGYRRAVQELHQRVGRRLRALFHDPMAGVRQHNGSSIRRDQLHLLAQGGTVGLIAAD
jgi:hypothetical protein